MLLLYLGLALNYINCEERGDGKEECVVPISAPDEIFELY